jgi:hypothetical protein
MTGIICINFCCIACIVYLYFSPETHSFLNFLLAHGIDKRTIQSEV